MVTYPPPALLDPTHGNREEAPSQALLPLGDHSVLFVCLPYPEVEAVCSNLLEQGIRPNLVQSVDRAPAPANSPRHCLLDWSLPGVPDYLSALDGETDEMWPIAIVENESEAALAYARGAVATIRKPLRSQEILACLRVHRHRRARRVVADAALVHDQRITAADTFESMLRTLGQELRNPLATALANIEYFVEQEKIATEPLLDADQSALLADTLAAMQSLRSTLEGMTLLLPRDPPVLEQVRLWRVAQRVVDTLPRGTQLVELRGEPGIRGWGHESTLADLVSLLVRRALRRHPKSEAPAVSMHVYAHDTEARITVRERPLPELHEQLATDPFGVLTPGVGAAQGSLQLLAARHAVVKMGGLLSYVVHDTLGYAFRVRLRLAQAA